MAFNNPNVFRRQATTVNLTHWLREPQCLRFRLHLDRDTHQLTPTHFLIFFYYRAHIAPTTRWIKGYVAEKFRKCG